MQFRGMQVFREILDAGPNKKNSSAGRDAFSPDMRLEGMHL